MLGLVSEQVHQVVHGVNLLEVVLVPGAPLRKKLLTEQVDQVANVLVVGKVDVLSRVVEAHFDLVDEWTADRDDHWRSVDVSHKKLL